MQQNAFKPEFISLERNNNILFYCGVRHSWNPNDLQFVFLKEAFSQFLKVSKDPMAVVEAQNWVILSDENETIRQGGESSFIAFLCKQKNIPVVCFEPSRGDEMNALLEKFSKEQIEYYYFARTVAQWHRLTEKTEIHSYVNRFLERDKKVTGWNDFDFSITHMGAIHKKLFGDRLDLNDAQFFQKIENPNREDNPLKEVVRASGAIRDDIVAKSIFESWWGGRDLFVVYGNGHTARHINRIQNFLNDRKKKTA